MALDISSVLFITQFFIALGITLAKLYNLMSVGNFYMIEKEENKTLPTLKMCFILFIGFFLAYFIGFSVFMVNTSTLIYSILFKFESLFIILNVLFLIGELFIYMQKASTSPMEAYKSPFSRR